MAADPRELVASRLFPAPPSRVYAAFADPAQLARWWGPLGTSTSIHAFDLRPGGRWHLTMSGPWGEATMEKTFDVVEPGRRVVVRHQQAGHTFTLDMAFEPAADGTRLTWRTAFATAGQLAAVRAAFVRGNEENLDRLGAWLAAEQPDAIV